MVKYGLYFYIPCLCTCSIRLWIARKKRRLFTAISAKPCTYTYTPTKQNFDVFVKNSIDCSINSVHRLSAQSFFVCFILYFTSDLHYMLRVGTLGMAMACNRKYEMPQILVASESPKIWHAHQFLR